MSAGGADEARTARSAGALAGFGLASLILVAVLLGLGTWQVERLSWKLDLIARVDARVSAQPVEPPDRAAWPRVSAATDEYRHVRVGGTFLQGRDTLVQAVTERGPGFWQLSPLRTQAGDILLVNRGFIPGECRTGQGGGSPACSIAPPDTPVTVTGLLRVTEPGGGFLRSNDPAANRWYSRDVAAIAAARGLGPVAPYFIDADATPNPGGLPVGGLTVIAFANNHLVYAITWCALALLLGGAAVWVILEERRFQRASRLGDG